MTEILPGDEDITDQKWQVLREDIHGNQLAIPFVFDTKLAAKMCRDIFTHRGHHQTYSVEPHSPPEIGPSTRD